MDRRVDILAPGFRADPYPHYAELRRSSPVCQVDPGGMWAVSRHEDVIHVLRNPALFSSAGFKAAWQPPWLGYNPLANSLLAQDPPTHTRLRGLVSRAFGPAVIARMEPRLRALAGELAGGVVDGCNGDGDGWVDFVDAFAMPLPAFAIADLLGLDPDLCAHFKRWGDDLLSVTPEPGSPERAAHLRGTVDEVCRYIGEAVAARRRAPAEDLTSQLLRAEVDGQRLGDAEVIEMLVVLLFGGFETTTHLLGNTMIFLAAHPEEMTRLRADPSLIPAFVEEMNRYDGPSQSVPRIATEDVTLAGVSIPRGAMVLPLVGSANRDERRYPDPDRFDLHRGAPGVGFGHGIHACIGAMLARMEAKVALEALVARFRGVELAPGEIQYNRTLAVRGPTALPLRLLPA